MAAWAKAVHLQARERRHDRQPFATASTQSTESIPSRLPTYAEIAANGALALIAVAMSLLDRQLSSLARAFETEGGFAERLSRYRRSARKQH